MDIVWGDNTAKRKFWSQIGSIFLDADIADDHTLSAQATTHPIEDGSNISDHVHNDPRTVRIEGFISNHPIDVPPSHAQGVREVQKEFTWKADPDLPLVQVGGPGVVGAVTGAVASAVGADIHKGTAKGFEPLFDRAQDVFSEFEAIWSESRLIDIVTTLKIYPNMIIEELRVSRSAQNGQALAFVASARQISIVETSVVEAGIASVPVDPTVERAKPESPQGKQSSPQLDDTNPASEAVRSVADQLLF